MSENRSFYRKVAYLVALAVLMFPISWLGAPATLEEDGGKLAQMRVEYGLGQAEIGEIDPASATMRLVSLGMRGVAVSWLWSKANHYKKTEDWTSFRATLRQLSKLQPYFVSIWRYQAWDLSYNVSVELDAVQDRYHYVKRGIEYLKEGIQFNRNNPYLLTEIGWFIGHKIGRADERKQYRRLFKADDDYHPEDRPFEMRDNWLVAKKWYNTAIDAVLEGANLGGQNPTTFYEKPAKAQINYSEAIEKEGRFDRAKFAWGTADQMWRAYGSRNMRNYDGMSIRLLDNQKMKDLLAEQAQQLEEMAPGVTEKLVEQRRAALAPEELQALDMPAKDRSEAQRTLAAKARSQLAITARDVAAHIAATTPEKAAQAHKLAKRIAETQRRVTRININRDVANYAYWERRCRIEQSDEALQARELAFEGQKFFRDEGDLHQAQRLYEESFDLWAQVYKNNPDMPIDSHTSFDVVEYIDQYREVLDQLDLSLADEAIDAKFPLWEVLEVNDSERKYADEIAAHHQRQTTNDE